MLHMMGYHEIQFIGWINPLSHAPPLVVHLTCFLGVSLDIPHEGITCRP